MTIESNSSRREFLGTLSAGVAVAGSLAAATEATAQGVAPPKLADLAAMPPWLLCGGFFGVIVLGAMSSVPQRVGAATMIACLIAGQTVCGLLLDHYGALGLPQELVVQSIETQARAVTSRLDLNKLAKPGELQKLAERYLSARASKGNSGLAAAMAARGLTLLA